jgi:hypothetical protein
LLSFTVDQNSISAGVASTRAAGAAGVAGVFVCADAGKTPPHHSSTNPRTGPAEV